METGMSVRVISGDDVRKVPKDINQEKCTKVHTLKSRQMQPTYLSEL